MPNAGVTQNQQQAGTYDFARPFKANYIILASEEDHLRDPSKVGDFDLLFEFEDEDDVEEDNIV
uniref:Uncharacterized protein n=1 Tax=Romanomermis culicivorax TaxID=13658 RepID=A0A915I5B1_ROMCU